MKNFILNIPYSECSDFESLLMTLPEKILNHLKTIDENAMINSIEGNTTRIEILHPLGENWGDYEFRVKFTYQSIAR